MLTSSKKIVTFGIVGTMTLVLLLGTIGTNFVFVQTAYGIGDPNERSATQFAPGIVKDLQKEISASSTIGRMPQEETTGIGTRLNLRHSRGLWRLCLI